MNEKGMGIIESLVALTISSVMILGILQIQVLNHRSAKKSFNELVAVQLAEEKMENLRLRDPSTLDNSDDSSESFLQRERATFKRVTDITVNSDRSRTISINVYNDYSLLGTNLTIEKTIPLLGNK